MISSAADSGTMTHFGEALALVEAVLTISGVAGLMDGDQEDQEVARGAVHRVAEAMVAEVHMYHGAMAEAAAVDHGVARLAAAMAAEPLEEATMEETEVALVRAV